jgi:Cu(I)/Ag(I) efflux system membrane fusion protein
MSFLLSLMIACGAAASSAPGLEAVVDQTVLLSDALASDNLEQAQAHVPALAGALATVKGDEAIASSIALLQAQATKLESTKDIQSLRAMLHTITDATLEILTLVQFPGQAPLSVVYCPMAFDYTGGHWFQRTEGVRNPYFGAEMLACGGVQATLQPGKTLKAKALRR